MQTRRNEFPDFAAMERGWLVYLQNLPTVVGETAVNFFKDRFDQGGFIDKSFERWTSRKDKLKHKLLLNTFYLKNSIQVVRTTTDEVEVAPVLNTKYNYAEIHNNGGTFEHPGGTAYFYNTKRGLAVFVNNKTAEKFKSILKKDLPRTGKHMITIPKRQFIGPSEFLMKRLEWNHNLTVNKIIETHFK